MFMGGTMNGTTRNIWQIEDHVIQPPMLADSSSKNNKYLRSIYYALPVVFFLLILKTTREVRDFSVNLTLQIMKLRRVRSKVSFQKEMT